MLTVQLPKPHADKVLSYSDSGPPEEVNYPTVVLIHGFIFHNEVFHKFLPACKAQGVRLICPNRRGYPGSTPYSDDERSVITHGDEGERLNLIELQGALIALFLDSLIDKLSLPEKGGLTLAGWSFGGTFVFATLSAMLSNPPLSSERAAKLKSFVRKVIVWDAPTEAVGIHNDKDIYSTLTDPELSEETRGPAFLKYATSFWKHSEIDITSPELLSCKHPDPSRKATIEKFSPQEIMEMADFSDGLKCELCFATPGWTSVFGTMVDKVLLNPASRQIWPDFSSIYWLYGTASSWLVVWAGLAMEEKTGSAKANGPVGFRVKYRILDGANHMAMLEEPEKLAGTFRACLVG